MEQKPREFWITRDIIVQGSQGVDAWDVHHDPTIPSRDNYNHGVEVFHVIEYRVYDALQKERDELANQIKIRTETYFTGLKAISDERDSLKRELEQARQEAGEYYHRGLNDRGDEVAALKAENEKLKQIIKDHDAKGNDCPDLEGV